jgi:hypothetical protein
MACLLSVTTRHAQPMIVVTSPRRCITLATPFIADGRGRCLLYHLPYHDAMAFFARSHPFCARIVGCTDGFGACREHTSLVLDCKRPRHCL